MKTIEEQLSIIQKIIGNNHNIKIHEDGFISRGFVIDNGRLVFKFPRNLDVRYDNEIEILNHLNLLNLGVDLQKVAYSSPTSEYLGLYGVVGTSMEHISLTDKELKNVGNQLGVFLRKLHKVTNLKGEICGLQTEIESWQERVEYVQDFITKTFDVNEQKMIHRLMYDYMPQRLKVLGEKLVFSHGDLGDGNVFIDEQYNVGVIDFNDSGLLDEAADFMDISSDIVVRAMLDSYGANNKLREKVELRRDIRPFIVLKPYLTRDNPEVINDIVSKMRYTLKKYQHVLERNIEI